MLSLVEYIERLGDHEGSKAIALHKRYIRSNPACFQNTVWACHRWGEARILGFETRRRWRWGTKLYTHMYL